MDFRFYQLLGPDVKPEHFMCLHLIQNLSKNYTKSKHPGWCYASKETMAEQLKLSRRKVFNIIKELHDKELIEKNEMGYLKISAKANQLELDSQNISNEIKQPKSTTRKSPAMHDVHMQDMHTPEGVHDVHGGGVHDMHYGYAGYAPYNNKETNSLETSTSVNTSVLTAPNSKIVNIEILKGRNFGHISMADSTNETPPNQKKKSCAKKRKGKEPDNPIHNDMKKTWDECYQVLTGIQYQWDNKDARYINKLYEIIQLKIKQKHKLDTDIEPGQVLDAWGWYINSAYKHTRDWYRENFTITTLATKFNEVYNQITNHKNGKANQNNQPGSGADRAIQQIIAGMQQH